MRQIARTLVLVSSGALAGAVTHRAVQRTDWPAALSAVFLVGAAVTYPVADAGGARGAERSRELAALGATVGLGLASAFVSRRPRLTLLAGGWLSHAVFDSVHHRSSTSKLPSWYPAVCAGFDAVVAAQLLREARA